MDILIIGGLLVIGVGALVALFFVLRGGNTTGTKTPEAMPQTAREAPPTPVTSESTPQLEESHDGISQREEISQIQNITPVAETTQTPEIPPVAEIRTVPAQETSPVIETRTAPLAEASAQDGAMYRQSVTTREQPLRVSLNGQFHELSSGLRSLQQQATEMEQRLSALNRMLENIERNQTEDK